MFLLAILDLSVQKFQSLSYHFELSGKQKRSIYLCGQLLFKKKKSLFSRKN